MEERRVAGMSMNEKKSVITEVAVNGTCPSWQRKTYAIPRVGWRMCVGWSSPCMT